MAYNFKKQLDPQRVRDLALWIKKKADMPMTIMEVCGTHTHAILHYGLQELLPKEISLLSGPGCPVCVTAAEEISQAVLIAQQPNVLLCTFGDMIRVPCAAGSLREAQEAGAQIKIVFSPLDAIELAKENPRKAVVFLAVGFETTAPATAAAIKLADELGLDNFSILCLHKTMPQALRTLLAGDQIDALLCPGHVATITGSDYFNFIAHELKKPAVVAGFAPVEIMTALSILVGQLQENNHQLINAYPQSVRYGGNKQALGMMERFFEAVDSRWRGLGFIKNSGLKIRHKWRHFDAMQNFKIAVTPEEEPAGCLCGQVLSGKAVPTDCQYFATVCRPVSPLGACMVSSEGICAAYYQYR
ncbi:MAG: hydrogenase formation protein HypD [Bacillota bacterium]|jgi:hydrogenase expression/formation protein HypD